MFLLQWVVQNECQDCWGRGRSLLCLEAQGYNSAFGSCVLLCLPWFVVQPLRKEQRMQHRRGGAAFGQTEFPNHTWNKKSDGRVLVQFVQLVSSEPAPHWLINICTERRRGNCSLLFPLNWRKTQTLSKLWKSCSHSQEQLQVWAVAGTEAPPAQSTKIHTCSSSPGDAALTWQHLPASQAPRAAVPVSCHSRSHHCTTHISKTPCWAPSQ